ncbi:Mediator of RNA polymerase II transcription subunit 12 [Echinococcus granulosus]|nr:Mediator of RNA polymerase II transcription subunit 12 [Echinococcus granulosus]
MSKFPSSEGYPLKGKSSGPPDVYPQKPDQLEDALTEQLVKDGFKYHRPVADEYKSGRGNSAPQDLDTAWDLYYNILLLKAQTAPPYEPDNPQIQVKSFSGMDKDWDQLKDWLSDLSGANCNRRSTVFHASKERILAELVSCRFPLSHSLRLINKLIIHTTAPLENLKKKQKLDPTMEWTEELLRMLNELFSGDLSTTPPNRYDSMCAEWDYLFNLLTILYDNDLVEHWDVLKSLATKLDHLYNNSLRLASQDCSSFCSHHERPQAAKCDPFRILKFVLPYFQRFCLRFTESELLARRILYWACSAFSEFLRACALRSNSAVVTFTKPEDYIDFFVCSHHRSLLLSTSSIIIALTLHCPSAAVWNKITSETSYTYLTGSPLDLLPCPLSCLPIYPGPEASNLRKCLVETETVLLERGRLAESGWYLFPSRTITSDECTDETKTEMFVRVLDELDSHDFNQSVETHPIDSLFKKLFHSEHLESPRSITALVTFLCKWAVSPTRTGIHRSIILACLLDYLHSKLPNFNFQTCLLAFLDIHAPPSPIVDGPGFRSLVCLFAELIDRGLFNHDAFVRTYIARGVFDSSLHPLANADSVPPSLTSSSALPPPTTAAGLHPSSLNNNFSVQSEISEDNDRTSMDNPDSVRSDLGNGLPQRHSCDLNRHLQYLIHFPLPQDDSYAHEQNQRAQLLYGSSARAHSRARETPRKVSRDIVKLFTRSAHRLDVVHGELGKRKKNKERGVDVSGTPNGTQRGSSGTKETRSLEELLEAIATRFRCLNYYDMEYVISKSIPAYLRSLSGTISPNTTTTSGGDSLVADSSGIVASSPSAPNSSRDHIYYPAHNSLFLFLELIETSLNILSLLDTVVETLERLQASSLSAPYPCMSSYLSLIWLHAIGILRTHQAVLMTQPNLQQRILTCLIEQLRRGTQEKLQSKWCILEYLRSLYLSSAYVKRLCTPSVSLSTFESLQHQLALNSQTSEILRRLRTCAEDRKTLVDETLKGVLQCRDPDRLVALSDRFVDYTVQCPELALEWLPSMAALVNPSLRGGGVGISSSVTSPGVQNFNSEMSSQLDDPVEWDNLASLIGTLLAHHCIDTEKLFDKLINPSLAFGLDQSSAPIDSRSEPTVRLACHILHRFFTVETVTQDAQPFSFRVSEPSLLSSALRRVNYALFIDTLKMLMIHSNKGKPLELIDEAGEDGSAAGSDDNSSDNDRDSERETDDGPADSSLDPTDGFDLTDGPPVSKNKRKRRRVHLAPSKNKRKRGVNARRSTSGGSLLNMRRKNRLASCIHQSTCAFLSTGQPPSDADLREMSLRDFAHLVLREICVTPWVREYFYLISTRLLQKNVLIDKMISSNQTRFLLHIIYHPHDVKWIDLAATSDNVAEAMLSLISSVNVWSLHATLMELHLLCHQISVTSSKEVLDQVANRIVTSFNEQAIAYLKSTPMGAFSASTYGEQLPEALPDIEIPENDNSWLLPSLIAKLPPELKTQIVTKTCDILNGIKLFWRHKNDEDQERIVMQHSILLAHPVFSSILHVCMETVDPLERLYEQLEYFVSGVKETRDRMPENLRTRHILQECLALRLSLLGICLSSMNLTTDRLISGALILAQLIGFGVTEPHSNQTLFFTCLDMLHSLVHNLAAQVGPDNPQYQNLAKKVRKKLAERHFTVGIEYIRPLLFIGRTGYPFVAVTPLDGTAGSGNRGDGGGGAGKLGGSSKFASVKSSGKSGGANASRYSGGGGGGGGGGSASATTNSGNNNGNPSSGGGGVKTFTRKRGYAFVSRDRFAPWEIYDVNRRPAFLAMCGAVQVPATQSQNEEQANILLSHEHPITHRRSEEFYIQSLFHEAEPSASSTSATAVSSPSSSIDSSSKQFILGSVPSVKRHPGVEGMPRRIAQQTQRLSKPEDIIYRQQQQQQAPPLSMPPAQMRMQAPSQQPTKRKRSRAAAQQPEEMLLPPPPPPQMYHQGMYPPPQTSSAMAAAQAAESMAAATTTTAPTTVTGKRKRMGGMVGGGGGTAAAAAVTAAPAPSMRRGVAPPPRSYDNGAVPMPSQQQTWGGGRAPSAAGGSGRVPNQRQNLSEFVQNQTKAQHKAAQQQQMAAAFAAGVMPMEEQFSQQQQQQDPRFRGGGGGGDPNYGFAEMMPPQSCASGPFVPDFAAMDSQLRHHRQQQHQQRYIGGGGAGSSNQSQQVVPDPPPYPGRSQPTKALPPQPPPSQMMMQTMGPSTSAPALSMPTPAVMGGAMTQAQHRAYMMSSAQSSNSVFIGEAPRAAPAPPPPHFSRLYDTTGGGGGDYR